MSYKYFIYMQGNSYYLLYLLPVSVVAAADSAAAVEVAVEKMCIFIHES